MPTSLALKLIDYDGMWVPALAGTKSGEVGHPNYQHPQRMREGTYSMEVDRFPVLLVAAALRALKAKGKELWEKYDNGDNLLFKESDLREPAQAAVFQELLHMGDPATVVVTVPLLKSLWDGLELVPLLEEVMPESRPAPASPPARPSRLAQTAVPVPVAMVPVAAGALEFDEPAPGLNRPKGKWTRAKSPAVPMKVWISAAVAAVAVIGLVGGLAAWVMWWFTEPTQAGDAGPPRLPEEGPGHTPALEPETRAKREYGQGHRAAAGQPYRRSHPPNAAPTSLSRSR